MERDCFLCSAEPLPLRRARWNLPLLPVQRIAYGVCPGCGMVLETESATPEDMLRYYSESAVYTNPGRGGLPTPGKVRGVERSIQLVREVVGHMPASVFQVGCSDGYTLSRFQEAGAERVDGVDPSPSSSELADSQYGLATRVGTIEDLVPPRGIELWVMTHVLEHLYDPLQVLRRARESQASGDWLLVEVPLFERPELFPPGYLTFEHLNYFSETTLMATLSEAGYEEVEVRKSYEEDLYPVITVLARASEATAGRVFPNPFAGARLELGRYLAREESEWSQAEARVHAALQQGRRAWVWGAGIHSSQLFAATDIESWLDIQGMVDSSSQRQGQSFGPYQILSPEEVSLGAGDAVVISSRAAEHEIYDALGPARRAGVEVVCLYTDDVSAMEKSA